MLLTAATRIYHGRPAACPIIRTYVDSASKSPLTSESFSTSANSSTMRGLLLPAEADLVDVYGAKNEMSLRDPSVLSAQCVIRARAMSM
jgi:hypothetical protein